MNKDPLDDSDDENCHIKPIEKDTIDIIKSLLDYRIFILQLSIQFLFQIIEINVGFKLGTWAKK